MKLRAPERLATRLSVSFVLLFVVTFAAVGAVTLYYTQRTFQTTIDDNLDALAQSVDERLALPSSDSQQVIDDLSSAAQFIALFDAHGDLIERSQNSTAAFSNTTGTQLRGPLSEAIQFRTINAGKTKLRTIRYPVVQDGVVTGYIVVASPIPEVDDAIQSLAVLIVVAGAVGMSVAVVGIVWLSLREARPLKELTDDVGATAASGFELDVPRSREGSVEARQLREAFANLVEEQRAMIDRERAFFADSSHVLRTPLAVLQGDIEQLEQGVYGKERLEVVAQARNSLGTMSRTVNGLLLLAREHEAAPGSTWEVVEMADVLHRIVGEARVAAPNLELTAEASPPLEVAGDPHQLQDLFSALIENACHYTPAAGTVEVVATRTSEDNLEVEVRDSGVGLSEEDAAHVMQRFYRGSTARKMFPGGSGLGLAIADRIARLHGGELTLRPREGGGTIATVKLPLIG